VDRQTDRQTYRQTYIHTDIQTHTHTHTHTYIYISDGFRNYDKVQVSMVYKCMWGSVGTYLNT